MNDPIYGIPPDLVRGPEADALPMQGEVNWGMEVMGIHHLRKITDGEAMKVGAVDTGVDDAHPLLTNLAKARDFTGSSRGSKDVNGHGTHVTGTIGGNDPRIGVGSKLSLYHGKGLSDGGSGSMASLLDAIEWCLSAGCTVVSNSWGGGTSVGEGTQRRLREWAERGVWLIFAAGNSGGDTQQTDAPGNSEHVINVAALNQNLSPASFTSAGAKIDTAGPGVNIWSAKPGGGFKNMSGTSMACPYVAGAMGLYRRALELRSLPIPTIYQLRELLFARSTDAHTPGDDLRTGPGWASPMLLSLSLTLDPPPIQVSP